MVFYSTVGSAIAFALEKKQKLSAFRVNRNTKKNKTNEFTTELYTLSIPRRVPMLVIQFLESCKTGN